MSDSAEEMSGGAVRHALRTPLHVINGNVEILLRLEGARLTIEGRRSLAEIADAVRLLERAVGLVLAGIEAGTIRPDGDRPPPRART